MDGSHAQAVPATVAETDAEAVPALTEARERTLGLVASVSDADLERVHSTLMSPLVWDLGHIAAFEDLWLVHRFGGRPPVRAALADTYDAFETPRAHRGQLDFLGPAEARAYLAEVREASLAVIAERGVGDGILYELVLRHELQHSETMLQTVQLARLENYIPPGGGHPQRPGGDHAQPPGGDPGGDRVQPPGGDPGGGHVQPPGGHAQSPNGGHAQSPNGGRVQSPNGGRVQSPDGGHAPSRNRDYGGGLELVKIPAGPCTIGAGDSGFAYDNERPRHRTDVRDYLIGRTPITNASFLTFVEGGGYERREWWSAEGWAWKEDYDITRPGGWTTDHRAEWRLAQLEPLDPDRPVVHVSWFEADAFARAHGLRLPTEAEWEKAATWDQEARRARPEPWGEAPPEPGWHANLDARISGPAPVGAYPAGASSYGCLAMLGDVWEWTATPFTGYPGFRAFPYPEYSEVFFGSEYLTLRGGSWATSHRVASPTFRNWDYPQRRQIFSGFRVAKDLAP